MKLFRKLLRMQANFSTLESKDVHNCLHIKLNGIVNRSDFELYLKNTLKREQQQKNKAVWIHVDQQNMQLVTVALNHEFKIHHGIDNRVVLYRWIWELSDLVPKYSLFYIATGAIVIHQDRVLLVQQKNGARKDDWGIPGGLAQVNEPLAQSTVRELKQQTNLTAKYLYMLYFRQLGHTLNDGTDFYFANVVQIQEGQQKNLKLCDRQLKNYKWVHLGQTEQFIKNHQIRGTQKYLLNYLAELFTKKYDFNKELPNQTKEYTYQIRGVPKYYKEHRLVSRI